MDDLDISIIEDDSSEDSFSEDDTSISNDREILSEIDLYFIYINGENAIDKVEKMTESMTESPMTGSPVDSSMTNCISKERLLQIVQTKRLCDNKKYKLDEIMSFQIPLEYNHLESFIKDDGSIGKDFFQPVQIFNEVIISPALFIFHELTALYFFFSEAAKPLKSVLRDGSENRVTKKVRIKDESIPYDIRKRKSLKRFLKKGNTSRKVCETI
jgi:hypothetical protein